MQLPVHPDELFPLEFEPKLFNEHCLKIFQHQVRYCSVYSEFIEHLGINPSKIDEHTAIPHLPVEFFKTHQISTCVNNSPTIFTSSGTSSNQVSSHYVNDIQLYIDSFTKGFEMFYGSIKEYCILALLPSYLERKGSSLIYMADHFINSSTYSQSGFYLNNHDDLKDQLIALKESKTPTLLLGVSFALLDFVEKFKLNLPNLIVMETGGMKGRREEITREELHTKLKKGFGVDSIHSEYGMTELLSQAYSNGNGIFYTPPWMKVSLRDPSDPLSKSSRNSGGINIIDLANINSCSFLSTNDIGRKHNDNSFEILGRFDHSDVRGCNLMVQ